MNQQKQKPPVQPKEKKVDLFVYERFTDLKFLVIGGATLKPEAQKELDHLEKEVKSCSGVKAKKSVTAHVGSEVIRLVEDCPIPEEYQKIIKENKAEKHYIK